VQSIHTAHQGDRVVCDIVLERIFTEPIENTLKSGLPVVVDLALQLEPEGGTPLGQLLRSEAEYDVWEDFFILHRGTSDREYADFSSLRAATLLYDDHPLAAFDLLADFSRFWLSCRVAVSPLSGEERERMARWLAEAVADPQDPASREVRLDLGGLINMFFKGGEEERGWGPERRFGPFELASLPVLAGSEAVAAGSDSAASSSPTSGASPDSSDSREYAP
jgi:hypothetical protein